MKKLFLVLAGILVSFIPISANLIENGDFSNDLQGWTQRPYDAVSVSEGMAVVDVGGDYSDPSDLQLSQNDIDSIEYGGVYELSFDAFSQLNATSIDVIVKEEYSDVYYDTSLRGTEITETQTTFTSTFIVKDSSSLSEPSIQFNCGLAESDIAIDNVTLTKSDQEGIIVESPSEGDAYPAGDTVSVTWFATPGVEEIAVSYSIDGGQDWTSVVDSTLFDEVEWEVPDDTSENVIIRVSDAQGDGFGESGVFSIGTEASEDTSEETGDNDTLGTELIENGDFSDSLTGWNGVQLDSSAQNWGELVEEGLVVHVDTLLQNPWDCQLQQDIGALEQGTVYRFSFDASASEEMDIFPRVSSSGYELYLTGDTVAHLTSETQTFTYEFQMEENDDNPLVQFNLCTETADITLDDISLVAIDNEVLTVTNPSAGDVFHVTSSVEVEWATYNIDSLGAIQIDYSINDGEDWRSVAEDVSSVFGGYQWDIPEVSSDKCRLRITAHEGAYTDVTGRFEITPEYDPAELEQVTNGDFSDGSQDWDLNVQEDSAAAGSSVENEKYLVTIDDGGSDPAYLQVLQTGITLEGGASYELSFDVVSTGERNIIVNLGKDTAGYPSYGDIFPETLSVGTNVETYNYEFVMDSSESDENAVLNFLLGGTSSDVIIDNVSLMLQAEEI
ncbi:MAG: carbohydrate binding domain-containing protein, partial [Chitinivibrionales bacterium]